ncbi:MAG: hypothetical protein B5M53_01135 [Candidatus Cloacimonas sp. 4484_209]|nr:MAG: hypothetical protein B5M53_01135 [Candidatus Cloacimonas sp. 4484_209]
MTSRVAETSKVKDYWQKIRHALGIHEQERPFFDMFVRAALGAGRILEIGVGDGRMQRNLVAHGVHRRALYGVDFTDNLRHSVGHKVFADAHSLPFPDNTFDIVYSLGVIEHSKKIEKILSEHLRVLKQDGYFFITAPHLSPFTLVRYLHYFRTKRYRQGSMRETMGLNLSLSRLLHRLKRITDVHILDYGAVGPLPHKLEVLLAKLKIDKRRLCTRFGAYLYVVGRKK